MRKPTEVRPRPFKPRQDLLSGPRAIPRNEFRDGFEILTCDRRPLDPKPSRTAHDSFARRVASSGDGTALPAPPFDRLERRVPPRPRVSTFRWPSACARNSRGPTRSPGESPSERSRPVDGLSRFDPGVPPPPISVGSRSEFRIASGGSFQSVRIWYSFRTAESTSLTGSPSRPPRRRTRSYWGKGPAPQRRRRAPGGARPSAPEAKPGRRGSDRRAD